MNSATLGKALDDAWTRRSSLGKAIALTMLLGMHWGCTSTSMDRSTQNHSITTNINAQDNHPHQTESQGRLSNTALAPAPLPTDTIASFESQTLYDLLIAEVAGKRGRLDIALGNYMKQAHGTQDINIIKRYAAVASYMHAGQATLDAGKLWLSITPNDPDAHSLMMAYYLRSQTPELIKEHVQQILLVEPDAFDYELIAATTRRLNEGAKQKLFETLKDLSAQFQQEPALLFLMANVKEQQKAYHEALALVEKGQKIDANFLPLTLVKIDLFNRLGDKKKAIQLLKKTAQTYPQDKKLNLLYARALISEKDYKRAQRAFEDLVEQYPTDGEMIMTLAILSVENKRFDAAKAYLEQLILHGQRTDDAYTYLGQISENEQDLAAAIGYYSKVKTPPLYTRAQLQISKLYIEQSAYDKAIAQLKTASGVDPEHQVEYQLRQSELMSKHESNQAAFDFLTQALEKTPESIALLYARAMLADKINRIDILEQDLRAILELNPKNAVALNALGYSLADRGLKLAEALTLIEQAHELKPKDAAIIDSLGWVHFKLGNIEEAVIWLAQAYQGLKDPEIIAHYIEALVAAGQTQKAIEIYEIGLETFPQHRLLLQLKQRLELGNN